LKKTIGYDILEGVENHPFKYFFFRRFPVTDREARADAFAYQGGVFLYYRLRPLKK